MDAREQITYWTTLPSVESADMDAVLERFGIDGAQTISEYVAKLAAADVLDRVAMAMALKSGVTRVEDITIDRGRPALALRELAARLRAEVADADDPGIAVAEFSPYPSGIRW